MTNYLHTSNIDADYDYCGDDYAQDTVVILEEPEYRAAQNLANYLDTMDYDFLVEMHGVEGVEKLHAEYQAYSLKGLV